MTITPRAIADNLDTLDAEELLAILVTLHDYDLTTRANLAHYARYWPHSAAETLRHAVRCKLLALEVLR
jgi:hypothetical protein